MLSLFHLNGQSVTTLDIKALLVSAGVQYPDEVYQSVAGWARLDPPSNPFACNCLILPGEVATHLHPNPESPFALGVDESGQVVLFYQGDRVTTVDFPKASAYYQQTTREGNPFGSLAVLEGRGTLAFFYLWKCQYTLTRETCSFCFQVMADMAGYNLPSASEDEVAEVIEWAVENAGVQEVQLTAGTLFDSQNEAPRYAKLLRTIDQKIGLDRLGGEIYCYMTASRVPESVDQIFAAGVDRIGHDLHVWDAKLHAKHAPGHSRKIGRATQLKALEYIADKYGPNKAFSAFVAGLEPLESMLEGAEYLASRGIVPAFSVWMPTPGSVTPENQPPGLEYYQAAQRAFAQLYTKYGLNPPGTAAGSHVSLCRDIYRHREALLALPVGAHS